MKKILSIIIVALLLSFPLKIHAELNGVLLGSKIRVGEYTPVTTSNIEVEQDLINKIIETKSLDNSLVPILFSALISENFFVHNEIDPDISFNRDEIIINGNSIPIDVHSGIDMLKGFSQGNMYRVVGINSNEKYIGLLFPYNNEDYFYTINVDEYGVYLYKYVPVDSFDVYKNIEKERSELEMENILDALENAYENKPSLPSFDSGDN